MNHPINTGIRKHSRTTIAQQANDEPRSDLLTQGMLAHEKNTWMLR